MTKSKRNNKNKSRTVEPVQDDPFSRLEKLDSLIGEAEAALDSFSYDAAEAKLQEVLQIDPNNCKGLEMLSSVYIEMLKWKEAKSLLQKCIEISPETGYSKYFSLGQLYEGLDSLKWYEKGIQLVEKELEDVENVEPSKENNKSTLQRNLSDAYCSIAEIFMTDCCFEENAEEKCCTALDMAIKADPKNPEAYQCMANYQLVKEQMQEAKESLEKSLSLWLPYHEALRDGETENLQNEPENPIPVYDSRIKTSKLLIELDMFHEASKILEGLVEEDDEVVEVWYLLGWLNYSRGEDEYKANAHFFLKRAKEVSKKLGMEDEDECIDHINELLEELKTTHPLSDDEGDHVEAGDDEEWTSDSDDEDDIMET